MSEPGHGARNHVVPSVQLFLAANNSGLRFLIVLVRRYAAGRMKRILAPFSSLLF